MARAIEVGDTVWFLDGERFWAPKGLPGVLRSGVVVSREGTRDGTANGDTQWRHFILDFEGMTEGNRRISAERVFAAEAEALMAQISLARAQRIIADREALRWAQLIAACAHRLRELADPDPKLYVGAVVWALPGYMGARQPLQGRVTEVGIYARVAFDGFDEDVETTRCRIFATEAEAWESFADIAAEDVERYDASSAGTRKAVLEARERAASLRTATP